MVTLIQQKAGCLYILKFNGSLTRRKIITTDFTLWGVEFVGDDLFAVVGKTNQLTVYTNFTVMNTTNATVSASKKIAIEGIVKTHGLDMFTVK